MPDSSMRVLIELAADARKMMAGMKQGERGLNAFASRARHTAHMLRNSFAGIGVSIGAGAVVWQSAQLDKSLTQIGQTAGGTGGETQELRKNLFALGRESGQSIDSLKDGFNVLVQTGLNMKEARATLEGVNRAMAVTGADAKVLANGLTVAAEAFQFDLSKPGMALEILDKMTVAGRLGNAELENLSDIFARVGVNAKSAGMGFEATLAFVEGLSKVERQPERLATLADSTLRVFTNLKYMADAQKATGIKFFDAQGTRRDAVAVLADIRQKYSELTTDAQRANFIQAAFGKADMDTIKGLKTLLSGDALDSVKQFSQQISNAGGTLKRDMSDATRNLIDQAGRLKVAMREAADGFVQPINRVLADTMSYMMSKEEESRQYLPDWQATAGVGAIGTAAVLLKKYGGKIGGKLLGGTVGTGVGIAEGKAIEAATGVQPVFVAGAAPGVFSSGGLTDLAGTVAAGGMAGKALGLLTKIGPLIPLLTGPVGLAIGGVAAAGGLVWWIKSMMKKEDEKAAREREYFGEIIQNLNEKNIINLSVRFDQAGRVDTSVDDLNTSLHVSPYFRGAF